MKNRKLSVLALCTVLLYSCGGSKEESAKEVAPAVDATTLLADDGPKYDVNAIDSTAPVVELSIAAIGANMSEMKYDKSNLEVASGSTVKLNFESKATDPAMPHNWILKGMEAGADKSYVPSDDDILVASKLLGPDEKQVLTFPAPPVGEYQFVCTYPGHSMMMQGVFIVK
jgi:azurin